MADKKSIRVLIGRASARCMEAAVPFLGIAYRRDRSYRPTDGNYEAGKSVSRFSLFAIVALACDSVGMGQNRRQKAVGGRQAMALRSLRP